MQLILSSQITVVPIQVKCIVAPLNVKTRLRVKIISAKREKAENVPLLKVNCVHAVRENSKHYF